MESRVLRGIKCIDSEEATVMSVVNGFEIRFEYILPSFRTARLRDNIYYSFRFIIKKN